MRRADAPMVGLAGLLAVATGMLLLPPTSATGQNPPAADKPTDAATTRPSATTQTSPPGTSSQPLVRDVFESDAERIATELALTAAQRITFDQALQEIRQEVKRQARLQRNDAQVSAMRDALREQLLAAREAGDRQKMAELRTRIRDVRSGRSGYIPQFDLLDKLAPILTAEQQRKATRLRTQFARDESEDRVPSGSPAFMLEAARNLKLSEQQKAGIDAVEKEFAERFRAADGVPIRVYERLKVEYMDALSAVLDDAQRARFEDAIGLAEPKRPKREREPPDPSIGPTVLLETALKLDLTAEQKARVEEIGKRFAERIAAANPAADVEAYRTVRKELKEAIMLVLTAEQQTRLERTLESIRGGSRGNADKPAESQPADAPRPTQP